MNAPTIITPQHVEDLAREFYEANPHANDQGVPLTWTQVDAGVRNNLMGAARTVMLRFEANLREGMGQVVHHHREIMATLYQALDAINNVAGTPAVDPKALGEVMKEIQAIARQGLMLGRGVVS